MLRVFYQLIYKNKNKKHLFRFFFQEAKMKFIKGLNITHVPANMPRLSFGPCKTKIMKSVLAKFYVF